MPEPPGHPSALAPPPGAASRDRPTNGRRPSLVAASVALLLTLLLVLAGSAGPARADEPPPGTRTNTVEGTVRDDLGAPIAGAQLLVRTSLQQHGMISQDFGRSTVTDADGHYRFADVVDPADWAAAQGSLRAEAPGFRATNHPEFTAGFPAAPTDRPYRADFVLVRRDVTLRGRLSVRGGASPAGGSVTATATEIDPRTNPGNVPDRWFADVEPDGTWTMRVPPVPVRLEARSTYGLPTGYPDLPNVREDSPIVRSAHGETRDGLDISMRARLSASGYDEYGTLQDGTSGPATPWTAVPNLYPRDPHRSVLSTVGPRITTGRVVNDPDSPLGVPADDLVTITGMPVAVTVTVTNPGDDDLWLGDVRFEGATASCHVARQTTPCKDAFVLPGTSRTLAMIVDSTRWSDVYRTTLVLPSNAPEGELRLPIAVRNLATPDFDPNDPSHPIPLGLLPYFTPAQWALTLQNGNLPAPVRQALALGALSVSRTRLTAVFPAAGSATVTIARALPRRANQAARWRTVQRVRLTSHRAGRSARAIRPLAAGRYRLRTAVRITGRPVRTTTSYRVVRGR